LISEFNEPFLYFFTKNNLFYQANLAFLILINEEYDFDNIKDNNEYKQR